MRAPAASPGRIPPPEEDPLPEGQPIVALPMVNPLSAGAGNLPAFFPQEAPVAPRKVPRGVVAFDMDGTLIDDLPLIAEVAADVLYRAFGTPPSDAKVHYFATTGMPFEAQLAQLYPDAPLALRSATARLFHERKVREAYAYAKIFPEVPRLLKRLDQERWTLVVTTGAEREVAELLLEREGIRIWFDAVLGSGQGTKREHLAELRRRYPGAPLFLVGDSRFDLEAALDLHAPMLARASSHAEWTLTPEDFRGWGAAWSDYSLARLPEVLPGIGPTDRPAGHRSAAPAKTKRRTGRRAAARKGR